MLKGKGSIVKSFSTTSLNQTGTYKQWG